MIHARGLAVAVFAFAIGGCPGPEQRAPALVLVGTPLPTCVADPLADARHKLEATGEESTMRDEKMPDLDGDGVDERRIAVDSLCGATGNCGYALYLSNHGCLKFGGKLDGADFQILPTKHVGLSDLWSYWKLGCGSMEGVVTHWEFDGNGYVNVQSVSCACPKTVAEEKCDVRPKECPCGD
jgi:hypothetical protein